MFFKIAEILSQYQGSSLQLNGVKEISVPIAEQLAAYDGAVLSLAAIKVLPDEIADILAQSHAQYVDLRGVSQLSSDAIDAFKTHHQLANFTGIKQGKKKAKAFDSWMRQRCMGLWLELCDSYVDPGIFSCKQGHCHVSSLPHGAYRVTEQLRSSQKKQYIWY